MIGLVFAPSRRQISAEQAAAIIAAVRAAPAPHPRIVGLFVNAEPATVNSLTAQLGLDYAQLSGDEPVGHADLIQPPIIKTIRMDGSARESAWLARYDEGRRTEDQSRAGAEGESLSPAFVFRPPSLVFLVDAHVPGSYGGTGVVANWERAARLAARAPTILAGGLTPENVGAAIAAVRPLGVDVSSGVERDGAKDPSLIEAFLGSARAAHP